MHINLLGNQAKAVLRHFELIPLIRCRNAGYLRYFEQPNNKQVCHADM